MNKSVRRGAAGAAAAVAVVGLVAGCGDKVVKKDDLQKQIKQKVSAAAPAAKVGDVKCNADLKAKVKSKAPCTVTINGKKHKVTAVVDKVDGNKVNYSIKNG